jgi:hypothetical protein
MNSVVQTAMHRKQQICTGVSFESDDSVTTQHENCGMLHEVHIVGVQ